MYVCFRVCSVCACICAVSRYFPNKVNSDFYLTNPVRNFCFKTFYKKDPHIKSLSLDGRGFKNLFLFLFLSLLGLILSSSTTIAHQHFQFYVYILLCLLISSAFIAVFCKICLASILPYFYLQSFFPLALFLTHTLHWLYTLIFLALFVLKKTFFLMVF